MDEKRLDICRLDLAEIQIKTFLQTVQRRPQPAVLLLSGKQTCPALLWGDSVLGESATKSVF